MTAEAFYQFRQGDPLPGIRDLDVVMLTRVVETDDGDTMPEGSEGTVLSVYANGAAYVVEFSEPVGAMATVRASDLRLVERAPA